MKIRLLLVFTLVILACEIPSLVPTPEPTIAPTPTWTLIPPPVSEPTDTPTLVPPTDTPPTEIPTYEVIVSSDLVASYFSNPPVIDGDIAEWRMDAYSIEAVVYDGADHQGLEDLSATAMLGWDESFLFLAFRVIDNQYAQGATGNQIFRGDSIEILVDTNLEGDISDDSLSADDYQLGLSQGSNLASPESYLWYPLSREGVQSSVNMAGFFTDDGYNVEAAIPWNVFQITPVAGARFGFSLSVSDNDLVGENVQETMLSTAPERRLSDPTSWGTLQLIEP